MVDLTYHLNLGLDNYIFDMWLIKFQRIPPSFTN